jgi:hypothetical protein
MAGITASYITASSFSVVGDQTALFTVGRRVKCDCQGDGDKYGTILTSVYSSVTTITLTAASDSLTSNLSEAWFGILDAGTSGAMPDHNHESVGEGQLIKKIAENDTSVAVADSGTGAVTVTVDSNTEVDITDAGIRLGGADARVNSIKDEDDMTSDSAIALVTQQSVKAFAGVNNNSIEQTLTSTTNSVAWDCNSGSSAVHTLTENTTIAAPTNLKAGQTYNLRVVQAAGLYTLAFNAVFLWGTASAPAAPAASGDVIVITGYSDGTNIYALLLNREEA